MASLRECGGIIFRSPNSQQFLDGCTESMATVGVPFEELDLQATQKIADRLGWDISKPYVPRRIDHPDFGVPCESGGITGSVFTPDAGYVSDPQLATQNFCFAAQNKGATFMFQSKVVGIEQENGKVSGLKLANGTTVTAPIIVNAAGPYSCKINDLAFSASRGGGSVPNDMKFATRAMRQEVAYAQSPPGVNMDKHGMIVVDFDLGYYSRPEVGNKILFGGLEPECDPFEWEDGDIDKDMNLNLSDVWTNYIYRGALRIPNLPIPRSKGAQGIVAAYDVTPDWTPIYDKSALGGYYMAIGTSGNQFKNCAVAGELMAGLIEYCENGHNHDVSPYQYPTHRSCPGHFVDTKAFSRLRILDPSPTNVMG
jgi:sarcosine oxidase, subunit beta